jgi:hypothetical protein
VDSFLTALLAQTGIRPVLVDIGASGAPPAIWKEIAPAATYLGFDPDARDIRDEQAGSFGRSIVINSAVTAHPGQASIRFYLTASPHCSSTLHPDFTSLDNYLFRGLFDIVGEAEAPATTLDAVLTNMQLTTVDWFKTDSQGTDLRLFNSLSPDVRNGVLAVDVEPGLIDAYEGEDLFVDTHRALVASGFWLSSLNVRGAVRMAPGSVTHAQRHWPGMSARKVSRAVRSSPGWCEASYLRSLTSLQAGGKVRQYVLLWVFAVMQEQYGYAFDVALACGSAGHTELSESLQAETARRMRRASSQALVLKAPGQIWRKAKRLWQGT